MEQRDYLKDQLDKLGQVLGRLLERVHGFKAEGKYEQATQLGWRSVREELGVDLDQLLQLPEEFFAEGLQKTGTLTHNQLDLIASLLFESVEGLREESEKKRLLLKRLNLLLEHLNKTGDVFSFERHFKREQVQEKLKNG